MRLFLPLLLPVSAPALSSISRLKDALQQDQSSLDFPELEKLYGELSNSIDHGTKCPSSGADSPWTVCGTEDIKASLGLRNVVCA